MKVKPFNEYSDPFNEEDLYGFHFLKRKDDFYDDFYDREVDEETRSQINFTEKIPLSLYELLTDSEKIKYHEFLIRSAQDEHSESLT